MALSLHVPHLHVPHVGSAQDQAHQEKTKPSRFGGIILTIAMLVALAAWVTSVIALISLGPVEFGVQRASVVGWTALGIVSAISLFMMGVWKVHRA
ncbi:hypothetical protein [Aeromicrobium duanguangcaii]|uniref:Cell division protein CrgA n=1 Tax=Aeromicrobium duanguangcaii TaxID=2968086 RepID=A0ABY5KBH0_9ACTN|nr:hypothetical protein [Aeromicrobium duanguangcaii]MCD9154783.1 hypothetical protein [Aeromicrobium duanguangcaii]UUI67802.1 hypothetical protein NP095_11415 [Aeromicrobium duanguangcaii]